MSSYFNNSLDIQSGLRAFDGITLEMTVSTFSIVNEFDVGRLITPYKGSLGTIYVAIHQS